MAYIGRQIGVGNFVKLDSITTSATATYNLLNGGVAYSPQSPNHCIVSLNGVIQSPTTSFTISGSTIVFASALTATDVIDFILVLGDVLNIGTPSDATVTNAKLALTAGSAGTPAISIAADTNTGIFFPAADEIALTEGGVEGVRLNSSGNVQFAKNISVGGATPTTSGTGITFPASQSASTNANTLDDYEEGTWTPSLSIDSGSITLSSSLGSYTKIGRVVYLTAYCVVTSVSSPSGELRIQSIPFAPQNEGANASALAMNYFSWTAGAYFVNGEIGTASNQIVVFSNNNGARSNTAGFIQAGSQFHVSGFYYV